MPTDFSALEVSLTAAEAGGFRVAAGLLGITRPAVGQNVRRLEDSLGTALFQRTTRSIRLTAAGERLRDGTLPAFTEIRRGLGRRPRP